MASASGTSRTQDGHLLSRGGSNFTHAKPGSAHIYLLIFVEKFGTKAGLDASSFAIRKTTGNINACLLWKFCRRTIMGHFLLHVVLCCQLPSNKMIPQAQGVFVFRVKCRDSLSVV